MKKCSKCLIEKRKSEFYRDRHKVSGCVGQCIPCYKISRRLWVNPEKQKLRVAKWNKKTNYKSLKTMRIVHREKYKARWKLQYAVRSGKVVKPNACESCGIETKLEGHHENYSMPLDVKWLCRQCHVKIEMGESAARERSEHSLPRQLI